jgi:hypothetical protein
MHQPVDGRHRGHRVFENLVPFREDQVAADQHAAPLITLRQEREQDLHLLPILLHVSNIIQNTFTEQGRKAFAGTETAPTSEAVLKAYLAMPVEAGNQDAPYQFSGRRERLEILRKLSATSNSLAVIQSVLPSVTNAWQRAELAECFGRNIQTKESAGVLTEMLKDPDENVRGAALHGIRLMACRIDRGGRSGIQAEPAHAPKVEGLVPTIISAAGDRSVKVRGSAMYALADTREPKAIEEMRKHLQDADRGVRFNAACLLTEVHDDSRSPDIAPPVSRNS